MHSETRNKRSFSSFKVFMITGLIVFIMLYASVQAKESGSNTLPAAQTYGDYIIMGSIGEPSNLIPPLSTDSASSEANSLIYISLLQFDKDLNITTHAAESFEVLDEGKRLRFTLRRGIKWADGTPLTADDVAFTYRFMIDPKTPTAYAEDFLAVSEFRQTGPYSIEIVYEKPFARSLMTWMSAILPRHLLEGQDLATSALIRKPVGAGPFMLKSWVSGTRLTLAASPSYFEGRPNLNGVVYRFIPDPATMFLELKANKLDAMTLTPQQYLRQTTGPTWDANWRKYRYLSFSYDFLGFNQRHAFFNDVRVRRAISHAIDRDSLIKGALFGQGVPAFGPYKPGTWPYNNALSPIPYDLDKARALLAAAGWADTNNDGLLDRDGVPFAFTILTNQGNAQRIKAAIIIQEQLKAVGIKVQVRTVEWAAFINEFVHKGQFDAVVLAWTIVQDPDLFDVWHSSRATAGGLNFTNFRNPEVDALLMQARASVDRAERKALYDRFQEILHDEQPYAFLYVPYALPIIQARFQNIHPAPAGIMYNLDRWWVEKPAHRHVFVE